MNILKMIKFADITINVGDFIVILENFTKYNFNGLIIDVNRDFITFMISVLSLTN